MKRISYRQLAFIECYLACWNATEAARRAGYKNSKYIGTNTTKLLNNTRIRSEIEKRLKDKHLSADEVLARLAEHAKGDFSPFVTSTGQVDLTTDEARDKFYLLKKVKVKNRRLPGRAGGEEVETEIELHDPQTALVHIGRYHKLFTDKIETTDGLSEAERIARIIEILDIARERRNRQAASDPVLSKN